MKMFHLVVGIMATVAIGTAFAGDSSAGYDVVLLAGQSNMAGRGIVSASDPDGATSPDIFMWDPDAGAPVTARDPIIHPERFVKPTGVGPGLTFAKSYLARLKDTGYPNRKVLLVGAAWGGTSFIVNDPTYHHRWMATDDPAVGGDLFRGAVQLANAAITKAKALDNSSRLVAILWLQGESDVQNGGAPTYAANHTALMGAFRTRISGAGTVPIVVSEMAPCMYAQCAAEVRRPNGQNISATDLNTMLDHVHHIDDSVSKSTWVSSAGLSSNSDNIHFNAASQRELGKRFFAKFWQAAHGLPTPQIELRAYAGRLFNVGQLIDFDSSFNNGPTVSARSTGNFAVLGTASVQPDSEHGNVMKVDAAAGQLRTLTDAQLFNGSYTKMAWIKLNSNTYRNHILSSEAPSQSHYFYFSNQKLAAGHSSNTNSVNVYVSNPSSLPLGVWTHVAVTYDAPTQTMSLLVNGVTVSTNTNVPPATPNSGVVNIDISGYGSHPSYGLDGSMIGVRAYDTAFTESRVREMFDFETLSETGYGLNPD